MTSKNLVCLLKLTTLNNLLKCLIKKLLHKIRKIKNDCIKGQPEPEVCPRFNSAFRGKKI